MRIGSKWSCPTERPCKSEAGSWHGSVVRSQYRSQPAGVSAETHPKEIVVGQRCTREALPRTSDQDLVGEPWGGVSLQAADRAANNDRNRTPKAWT